jgi:hypothetical protein
MCIFIFIEFFSLFTKPYSKLVMSKKFFVNAERKIKMKF